jgi:hypothetical protein
LISGEWKEVSREESSPAVTAPFSYEQTAGSMKYREGNTSYDAKFDGKDYPVAGSQQTVSLRRIDDRTIDEVWKRDGKETLRGHMVISADGKTLTQTNFRDGKQSAVSVSDRVLAKK